MKLKKWISLLTCAFLLFGGAACGETETSNEMKEHLLLSFDSEEQYYSIYRVGMESVDVCTEKEFVSEGTSSMLVSYGYEVAENKRGNDIILGFVPENPKFFNKTTNTDLGYYAIDVYNAQESAYEAVVELGKATKTYYTLQTGWNTLYTYVDRAALHYLYQNGIGYYALTIRGNVGESPNFYVDNFRYYETEQPYEKYEFDDKKTIWHDFTNSAEATLFSSSGTVFVKPRLSINEDMAFVASGNRSLKIDFISSSYTQLSTPEKLTPSFDGYLGNREWYFVFEVYNDFDYPIELEFIFNSTYNNEAYSKTITIAAKSWANTQDARMYLDDINDALTGDVITCKNLTYKFKRISSQGTVYLDAVGIRK